jgi:hypothetical protein
MRRRCERQARASQAGLQQQTRRPKRAESERGSTEAGCAGVVHGRERRLGCIEIERAEIDQIVTAAKRRQVTLAERPNSAVTAELIVSEHRTELRVRQIGFAAQQAKGACRNECRALVAGAAGTRVVGAQVDLRLETDSTTLAATAVCSSAHAACATRALPECQLAQRRGAPGTLVRTRTNKRLLVGWTLANFGASSIVRRDRRAIALRSRHQYRRRARCAWHKPCHGRCTDRENRSGIGRIGRAVAIARHAVLDKPRRGS